MAVYTDTEVQAIVGGLSVEGVQINEQRIIFCDAVIYSIGIVPNTQIIKETSNVKGIYAAGDVAEFNHKISGLWGSALEQGTVAGTNTAASEIIYKVSPPVTILQAFDLALFSIGYVDVKLCD